MSQRLFSPLSVGLGLVALSSILFLGCAPKKETSSSLTSRSQGPVQDGQYLLAECNRIDLPEVSLKGQISTYYHYGQLVANYLNVNLTQVPNAVLTGTQTIQVFRWAERQNNQRQTNSIPVVMYFVQKGTGAVSNPNGSNVISKSQLESIISQNNLAVQSITVNNFFERHYVVLTGMETQWDAALFVLYNGSSSVGSGSVLLPAFYSNPNIYMMANPSTALQALHPNYSLRSSNASENDFYQMTEQICAGFFGSVRLPASASQKPLPGAEQNSFNFLSLILSVKESVTRFLHNFFGL